MKFGGASLRDGDAILHASTLVGKTEGRRVVVASAMAGITDLLLSAQDEVRKDDAHVVSVLEELRRRHEEALARVAPEGDDLAHHGIDMNLMRLERLLYGMAYSHEKTPRLHDLVQSFGERLVVHVLAAALRAQGQEAEAYDAERAGIRSIGPFGTARPDLDAIDRLVPEGLAPLLEKGGVPVVTGYYGVDAEGQATLFGRGGSDYVAALVAHALKAKGLELWKSVPGFLTADPDAVEGARRIEELGYDEAAELAQFGARVLHARSVEPLQEREIPLRVRSVHEPDAAGTVIRGNADDGARVLHGVTRMDGLAIMRLRGAGMAATPGVAKRIFEALSNHDINVLNMSASQTTLALLVDEKDGIQADAVLAELLGATIQRVEVLGGRSIICVVGRGMSGSPGSAARVLQCVADAGVNVEMVMVGASDVALEFIVKSETAPTAVKAIHDEFLRSA